MTIQEIQSKYGATYTPTATSMQTVPSPYQSVASKYGATYTPPTSTINKVSEFIGQPDLQNYVPNLINQTKTYLTSNPNQNILNALGAGAKAIGGAFQNVMKAPGNLVSNYFEKKPVATKIADFAHALGADVGAIFSPISAAFAAADTIPVLKPAADVVNAIFTPVGKVGTFATQKFVDVLPIKQESKDVLKPAFGEVGGLAAQILLGGKVLDIVTKGLPLDKAKIDTLTEEAKTQATQAKDLAVKANPQLETTQVKPATKENINRSHLNSIAQDFKGLSEILPKFKNGQEFSKLYEIASRVGRIDASTREGKLVNEIVDKGLDSYNFKAIGENIGRDFKDPFGKDFFEYWKLNQGDTQKIIQTTKGEVTVPETKTRGLSLGVQEKAVAEGLTKSLGDLPEYQTVNMADQAKRAVDLLTKDPELAKRVALGQEVAPQGIIPEAIFKAVEDKAITSRDIGTINELARSGLTGEATVMGQRIRTLAERDPLSPVSAIKEVLKAREDVVKRKVKDVAKATNETVDSIRSEIKKTTPKIKDWSSFIDSIKC